MNVVPFECRPLTNEVKHKSYLIYIRQYFPYTLTDRVASKPYLTLVDKKWIVFQLLHAYYQLVGVNEYHGDINFDNILLTTNMSVYLADYAKYKPFYFNSDDFTTINNWYSNEYNENKPIYFAPEKITEKQTEKLEEPSDEAKMKMDIFSIGVVIGQLFLENTFFTRVNLLNYKNKGQGNDKDFENKLTKINDNYNEGKDVENTNLVELLRKMLETDPDKRPTISECLKDYCNTVCPMPIPRCVLHMNCYFNLKYPQGDIIVATIYKYWTQIYSLCYVDYTHWNDEQKQLPLLKGKLHYKIFKVINTDSLFEKKITEFPFIISKNGDLSLPVEIELDNRTSNEEVLSLKSECMQTAKEGGYIFLNIIFHALQNIKYDSTVIIALEMIYHLSKELSQNTKVEFVIPHIVSLFSSEKSIIKIYALNCLLELLKTIAFKDLKLKLIDSAYFRSYIFTKLVDNFKSNCLLRSYFLSYLDKIALFQMKFLQCFIYNQVQVKDKESTSNKEKSEAAKRKLKDKELITLYYKETNNDTEECFYAQLRNAIIELYIKDNDTGKYDKEALIELIKVLPKVAIVFTPSKQNELQQLVFKIIDDCYRTDDSFISVITEVNKIIPQLAFVESNSYTEMFLNYGLKYENEIHNIEAIRSARQFVFKLKKFNINWGSA